jgi:pyruvate dehydrogenase E2 component (dihydrolipoamide acetyltransferase)
MSDVSDFHMPTLGADMEKGTLLQWYVKPGDEVHRGQVIAEVDTAKSAIEIEVFEDGVVDDIVVPVGEEVPVGTVLAHLRPTATRAPRPVRAASTVPPPEPMAERATVSPVLRRLAERLNVDLHTVAGTGRNGKITRADIEHAVQVTETVPSPGAATSARSAGLAARPPPCSRRRR